MLMSHALLYDAHHQRHLEDLPFWLELARNANGPILELGCGTGRILLPLLENDLPAMGLDLDVDMLAILQEKSSLTKHTPPLIRADMAAFHFSDRFSLIILPCNTLSTLQETARIAMLELATYHLAPGGLFAASIPNPLLLASLPQQVDPEMEESFTHPLDGTVVQVSNAWEHNDKLFTLHWYYDLQRTDGSQERFSATSYHNLIPASQYVAEFEAAGLTILHQYGDFKRRPFTRRAHNLILVARKPI